jgi:threonine dehydrogenase-like Zn-dependent dehydrogenase
MYLREVSLFVSRASTRAEFLPVVNLLASGLLKLDGFITHEFNLIDIETAFKTFKDPAIHATRIVVYS